MAGSHPLLGLTACFLYLGVCAAAIAASRVSEKDRDRKHWALIAGFFVLLAVLRGSGLEVAFTSAIRHNLMQDGLYENRRELQRPLAALAVVLISATLAFFFVKRPKRHGRAPVSKRAWARFWALIGVTLMCGVVLMRLISFHELDRYLYGPVRMNWVLDIGSSALIAFAALRFRASTGGNTNQKVADPQR